MSGVLKVKGFVFALLTLICVSPVLGEEQVYPEAKEWPKYAEFEWGMSEDEVHEACAKKKFERIPAPNTTNKSDYRAKGQILGRDAIITPYYKSEKFERSNGKGLIRKGLDLKSLSLRWEKLEKEDGEELFDKLQKTLRDKYGPSKVVPSPDSSYGNGKFRRWGASGMPGYFCLSLYFYSPTDTAIISKSGELVIKTKRSDKKEIVIYYKSKSNLKDLEKQNIQAKEREKRAKERAKEQEKDF